MFMRHEFLKQFRSGLVAAFLHATISGICKGLYHTLESCVMGCSRSGWRLGFVIFFNTIMFNKELPAESRTVGHVV